MSARSSGRPSTTRCSSVRRRLPVHPLSEWAFYIAALVYAFDRSGAGAAGFASLALLAPIAVAAPAAGKAAQHRRPERVRLMAYAVQTVALTTAAIAAYSHVLVAIVVGCCGITAGAFTFLGPACAVLLPTIVRSAHELTIANVWINGCESISTLGGSAMAALLLAVQGPALVLAVCAGLNLMSTAISAFARLAHLTRPPAATPRCPSPIGAARLVFRSISALRAATGCQRSAGRRRGPVRVGRIARPHRRRARQGRAEPRRVRPRPSGDEHRSRRSRLRARSRRARARDRLAPLLMGSLGAIAIAAIVLGLGSCSCRRAHPLAGRRVQPGTARSHEPHVVAAGDASAFGARRSSGRSSSSPAPGCCSDQRSPKC